MHASETWLSFDEYAAKRGNVFPSVDALNWFWRQNRSELVKRGAVVAPTNRKMVVPAAFDMAVADIGEKRAAALAERGR